MKQRNRKHGSPVHYVGERELRSAQVRGEVRGQEAVQAAGGGVRRGDRREATDCATVCAARLEPAGREYQGPHGGDGQLVHLEVLLLG